MNRRLKQAADQRDKRAEDSIPEELRNSAERILNYAAIPADRKEVFRKNLEMFRNIQDKSGSESRKIREKISPVFFEVYSAVFKKVLLENNSSPLYHMFLQYAYVDENLLQPEHTNALYELICKPAVAGRYSVYNGQEWLAKIYTREKDPSINEFGLDYFDVFREKKKKGELHERDKTEYDNNVEGRLAHEIDNLFRIGQRLCYRQTRGYFPILHSGMIIKDLPKSMITADKIEKSLNKVLEVDFSAFHREIVYNCPKKGIKKELIMKPVLPDFILMPTFGAGAVMWQELTGRVRTSPGRIILPIFSAENLDNLMVELVSKFRWELSRAMFSYSRNEVSQDSLIGEYRNYIQFYKKNRDLSEEAKEKVKVQIDKHRNNVGDIFASDYHIWINFESKGLLRLNKVAREILFKHCPFSESVRENLEKHPLYNQQITKFNNNRAKDLKLLEARYNKLRKADGELDIELMNNLAYYKM
jgi:hypothetical protein